MCNMPHLFGTAPRRLVPGPEGASPAQRVCWWMIGRGEGTRWPDVGEDTLMSGLLRVVPDIHGSSVAADKYTLTVKLQDARSVTVRLALYPNCVTEPQC